jgi:flagellar basal body-associated protein FliL
MAKQPADHAAPPPATAAAAAAADPKAPEAAAGLKRWTSKLKIGGIIAAVMIAECIVVYLVLPRSAATPAASADSEQAADEADHKEAAGHAKADASTSAKGHGKKGEEKSTGSIKSASTSEEIDLGEFSVTSYQPASNTTLFISFHLFGTFLHKHSDDLQHRIDDNKHRIRDNIIVIIRSAEITDLTDAGLGLIKRRILETTNKTLGKPLLQAVVFSDFSLVEQ